EILVVRVRPVFVADDPLIRPVRGSERAKPAAENREKGEQTKHVLPDKRSTVLEIDIGQAGKCGRHPRCKKGDEEQTGERERESRSSQKKRPKGDEKTDS